MTILKLVLPSRIV